MTVLWSRVAVAVFFFMNGAVLASWVPHIPAIKTRHMLSDGALGIVLLSMATGSAKTVQLAQTLGATTHYRTIEGPELRGEGTGDKAQATGGRVSRRHVRVASLRNTAFCPSLCHQ